MPLRADALELLATSAYMLGREDEWMTLLERAHHAHLDAGDELRAVRSAFWVGTNLAMRGELGPATGWLGRAHRLLEREQGECVERGYLLLPLVFQHEATGDYEAASDTAAEAAAIGERFADADLFALAVHEHGNILIRRGRVSEGLGLLDEAMVAVTAGELSPLVAGLVYCGVILACQEVYEVRRAREWTAALTRWCERQPDLMAFTGRCLVHRAEIMQLHGAWGDALQEARRAGVRLAQAPYAGAAVQASYRQGEVHRLLGDLRLFTPAGHDGLPGFRFPAPSWSFPTKDEMADYLEAYAARFDLPVRTGTRVDRLMRDGDRCVVASGELRFEADNVVVASGGYHRPSIPSFAPDLDPGIVQLHAGEYRDPSQLRPGDVLVVGVGNSGADIAIELCGTHRTSLSGPDKGHIPFRIESTRARLLFPLLWFVASRVLTVKTPIGRKVRPSVIANGAPLIRVKPEDIAAAGIERRPRTIGVRDGLPLLEDGRVMAISNVVWCTGFRPDYGWIDLPVFGDDGEPAYDRGVVASEPGLYFIGLDFLYAFTSENVGGVGDDAERIAKHIAARTSRRAVMLRRRRAALRPAPHARRPRGSRR